MNHIRLVSFGLSAVSIEGQDWIPKDPANPGALQIHRRGSAVYIRLVGLKPSPRDGYPEARHPYAPTFNVHEELVRYHHSPCNRKPWRAVFTIIATRDAEATTRYGTPEGHYPATVHCMITSGTVTKAHTEKLLLVIRTSIRPTDVFPVSAESAVNTYQDLLQQQHEGPPAFRFSFSSREGSMIERELKAEDLVMGVGLPVGRCLMDLALELLVEQGPPEIMVAPSLPGQIEEAIGWICTNPPPPTWHGIRMMPLLMQSRWCLLVSDYHDPPTDLAIVILSPWVLPAHTSVYVTESSIQTVGSQRVHVYPTFLEAQDPDRSAYFVWDYFVMIRDIILDKQTDGDWQMPVSADVTFQWLWDDLIAALRSEGTSGSHLEVTEALIAAQRD